MSKVATIRTKFKSAQLLIAALSAVGLTDIEDHTGKPVKMKTYDGEVIYADIRIPKEKLPHHSFADMGFTKEVDGTYKAQIADFNTSRTFGHEWLGNVTTEYNKAQAGQTLRNAGWTLTNTGVKGKNQTATYTKF